jgi:hypothetical protein
VKDYKRNDSSDNTWNSVAEEMKDAGVFISYNALKLSYYKFRLDKKAIFKECRLHCVLRFSC